MKPDEVGMVRYCYACGRKAVPSEIGTSEVDAENYDCECCNRPFDACPCTPAEDGECQSGDSP